MIFYVLTNKICKYTENTYVSLYILPGFFPSDGSPIFAQKKFFIIFFTPTNCVYCLRVPALICHAIYYPFSVSLMIESTILSKSDQDFS